MTRELNTKAENITSKALMEHLLVAGHKVSQVEREINDRPDLLFKVDDEVIGCECIQIPDEKIFKFLHTRFKQLEKSNVASVRVLWAQEQHYWVKLAIESKTKKINAYVKNSNAKKVWLLIHSPPNEIVATANYKDEQIIKLMQYMAKITKHGFDCIYFWDEKIGIVKLFPKDEVWTNVSFDFKEEGYPTYGFVMSRGMFKTTAVGEVPVEYNYDMIEPHLIIIPPLDPELRKHKPNYKIKKYSMNILAKADGCDATYNRDSSENLNIHWRI